jgi:hypothetical protein
VLRRHLRGDPAPAGGRRRRRVVWGSGRCSWWRGGGPSSCSSRPSRCSSSRPRGSAARPRPPPRTPPASDGSTRLRASSMACASVSSPPYWDSIYPQTVPDFPLSLNLRCCSGGFVRISLNCVTGIGVVVIGNASTALHVCCAFGGSELGLLFLHTS